MLQQGEKLPAYMLQSRPRSHRYFAASSSLRSEFDKSLKRFHRDLSVCPTGGRGGLLRNAAEVEMGYTPLGGDGSSAQEVGAGGLVRILDSGSSSTNRGSEAQDAREKIPLREESAEEFLFRKTREFNQTLEKNPKDVETWLEFSLFQEKFASLVGNVGRHGVRSVLEKKLSILKRAMKELPNSIPIVSAYVGTFEELNANSEADEEWQSALWRIPGQPRLWQEYIAFKNAQFSSFSVGAVRETYSRAFRSILALKRQLEMDHESQQVFDCTPEQLESQMMDLFLRFCHFERSAGYTERAVALLQALVEINCYCPIFVPTWETQVDEFEVFWDSEAPRFGEEGAVGWDQWTEDAEEELVQREMAIEEAETDAFIASVSSQVGGQFTSDSATVDTSVKQGYLLLDEEEDPCA